MPKVEFDMLDSLPGEPRKLREHYFIEDDGCYVMVGATFPGLIRLPEETVLPSEVFWQLVDDLQRVLNAPPEAFPIKVRADPTLPPGTAEMRSSTGQVVRIINIGTDEKED